MKTRDKCPFGEKHQKYWDKRYLYFSRFDEGIKTDAEGLFSVTPEKVALRQARKISKGCRSIVDAFGGVGGNAIAFAGVFDTVYMIEKDRKRLEMARNNAKVYGVESRIEFICGDFFKVAQKIKADAVFLDPPWGGPGYYRKFKKFRLENFSPDGRKILELSFRLFPKVILKVPRNFDFGELEALGRKFKVSSDVLEGRIISKTVYFD